MEFHEYMTGIMSSMIALEYMDHSMEKRFHGIKRWGLLFCGCLGYFFIMAAINYLVGFEDVLGLAYGIVLTLYGLAALKGKPHEIAALGLIWVLIAMISAYMMFGVVGIITEDRLGELMVLKGELRIYSELAAGILKFSMGRMILALYKRKGNPGQAEDGIMAGIFLILFLVILGMFRLEIGNLTQYERYCLSLSILGGNFAIILLMGIFYRTLERYRHEKREAEYREAGLKMQKEQIRDLYRASRGINRLRHDMKAMLNVLYMLLGNGKYEEAFRYVGEMGAELAESPELPQDTGNDGLNAALMKAVQECRAEGILFHYVVFGKPGRIDDMDMGRLLYNALSNGVEACRGIDDGDGRELELVVRELDGETEIYIENSICESVLEKNFRLQTQKKDKEQHGFGMDSIYEIVRKYHGEYVCTEEAGRFIQKILLRGRE